LDKIKKKLDKENGSSKSISHNSPNEKGRIVSASHHSPRHSNRREHSSSSPSPVRKLKKRYEVDDLQGEMNNIKPPTFEGEKKEG
jgi:hypothetical protein